MKRLQLLFLTLLALASVHEVKGQSCDPSVPVMTVDLTGQPNAVWVSPPDVRDGLCCGAQPPDKCIAFVITLDPFANGIIFGIASGAVPPGALYYQVNCGPPVPVGQILCLNGPGPHYLTFCKPGNNQNTYSITSLSQPTTFGTEYVSQSCSGQFGVTGLNDTTITWTSLPPNPVYNSYLSCTSGCPTVTLTPPATGLPPTITYQVCGYVTGGCFPFFFCDTFVVNMVNDLAVNITPQNQVICYGGPDIPITANVTGGVPPYQYLWSTGETTQTITVGAGVYTVQILDSLNCSTASNNVTVYGVPSQIIADAGPDQLLCMGPSSVQLSGSVQTATGGIWSGGTGTFSPGNTSLNAVYTPSPAEINAGVANLILTTTGNQGCPAESDTVSITISQNPLPAITGSNNVCEFATHTYTAPLVSGITYNWSVTGGTIQSTSNNMISVTWGQTGSGVITLTEVNPQSCDSTITFNVTINPQPVPVISGPQLVCTLSNNTYSAANPTPGNTYAWNVSGGTIVGSNTGTSINVNWTTPGNAVITLNEVSPLGCDSTVQIPVVILAQPVPSISGSATGCAGQTITYTTPYVSGNTWNWNVSGGNIVSGSNNTISVYWPVATTGTVTLTESNTLACDSTISLSVVVGPQPAPAISGAAAVCTGSTTTYSVTNPVSGDIYLWNVTGGTIAGPSSGSSIQVTWPGSGQGTVSVTQTNSFGCDSTVTVPVNILAMPSPSISGLATGCAGQYITYSTTLVPGNTYNWSVNGGTITANNNNSITVLWPSATTGTVTLTESNTLTCDTTISLIVAVGPQPAPVISGNSTNCTGTTTTYTVSNATPGDIYSWSVTGGMISGASNGSSVNIFWPMAGNGTITVTQTNSYGCDSTVSIPVTILTMPMPSISGVVSGCTGQSITYSTALVPGNTYNWNVTGGTITANNNNSITVYWPIATTGTVSVTEANTMACDSTVTISVVIGPQPAPVITGSTITCTGTISVYTVSNPVPGDTYLWSIVGGTIIGSSNSTSVQVMWTTAGQSVISLTQSNTYGCNSTVSYPVTTYTMPSPAISGNASGCAGQTITYTTPLVNGNTYTWSVTGGSVTAINNNSITVYWPVATSGTITLTEANTLACDSTISINVVVGPQPAPVLRGPNVVCTTENTAYSIANPTPGNAFSWTVTGGTIVGPSSGSSVLVVWNNTGLQTISVTESNNYNCSATASMVVDVRLKPSPTLSGPSSNCETLSSVYSVQNLPGHTYQWTVTGGSVIGTVINNSIEVLWTTPGTGSVSVRVISPQGCDSLVSKNVTIYPAPNPVVSGPISICSNETAMFSTTASGFNTYNWSVTNANIIGSTTGTTAQIQFTTPGVATITLTETTPYGCVRQAGFQVVVNAKPQVQVAGSNVGCIAIQQYQYSTPLEPFVTYQWTVTGGQILAGSGTNEITVEWQSPGQQTVTVTATNIQTGCDSTYTFNVLTGLLPVPVVNAPSLSGCEPLATSFSGNVNNPMYNYSWNFGDGSVGTGASPSHVYHIPGTYNVSVTATNNTGCSHTTTAVINVYPNPVAQFNMWYGGDIYYQSLSTLILDNLSSGGTTYHWEFGNGDTSSVFEPNYQYTTPGNYTVSLLVTNQYGCTDFAQQSLQVKSPEHLYIPNAFSPNNDNVNDYFHVGDWNITKLNIAIYNRWGDQIYSSENTNFMWDGTHNGRPAPEGVYVYQLSAKGIHGEKFEKYGTVTLIR